MKYSTKGAAQIPFLSQISIWKTEPLLQRNPHHVLDQFPYFFLPHWTTPHNLLDVPNHMPNQANQISYQAIYKSYTLLVKHPTYQKAESSRAASFLKLDSMYLHCKVCWTLRKIVGALSFSQPYLYIQPPIQSPSNFFSANSHLPNPFVTVRKISLAIPTNTPFFYTLTLFHFPIFGFRDPCNLH